jgi:hypothetical protein
MDPNGLNAPNGNGNGSDSTAQYVLTATATTCSHVDISGSYKKDTTLTAANTIAIDVTVAQTGNWKCFTDTVNGVWFDGSGAFTATGQQTITLQAHGKPTKDGQNSFEIHANVNSCSFVLTVYAGSANIPPIAYAGKDTTIALPASTANLNGKGTDADGTVTAYQWTKIAGPATFNIVNAGQAATQVNNLVAGTYRFELAVTDNAGAKAKDTMTITVQNAAALSGSLVNEQTIFGAINPLDNRMEYDAAGHITGTNSDYYPDRKIYYNTGNKISKIEWYYLNGNGTANVLGETYEFAYDANGNVGSIDVISAPPNNYRNKFAEYTWNSDNTMRTKKEYLGGSPSDLLEYVYTNGNVTAIIDHGLGTLNDTADVYHVAYDTRENKFNKIDPQFYFISTQTTFEQTDRSEIFFFSKNYPTDFDGIPVSVSTISSADLRPSTVSFYNTIWYRYTYAP